MPYFGYTPRGTFLHRLDETVASKCPWPPIEGRLAWTACDRLVLAVRDVQQLTNDEAALRPDLRPRQPYGEKPLCRRCRKHLRWEASRHGS